ncbi:MAG TPA: polysaccharide deacetylase family protein [Candidatus Aminicenantes bacterium]|nr:polysaccharide deacetylase family protein [Candidatus Aminicenantes bacterium]
MNGPPLRPRTMSGRRVLALAVLALAAGGIPAGGCGRRPPRNTAPDPCLVFRCEEGGIIRGRTDRREMALIFTGGDFADGGEAIRGVLREKRVSAGFFFTGDFYRSASNTALIRGFIADGHYLGPHSDKHLLYCSWEDRARTLVTREEFAADLRANYEIMETFGLRRKDAPFFIPPYEWYNRDISGWARSLGLVLFNFTPGTSSNADYTTPDMPEYLSSREIWDRIWEAEGRDPDGFNGFILLVHIGTDPRRTDKFYARLDRLIDGLEAKGYRLVRIDRLLREAISPPGNPPGPSAAPAGD